MTTPRTSAAVLAAGLLSPFALTLAALTAPAVAASDPVPGVPDAPGAPAGASGGASAINPTGQTGQTGSGEGPGTRGGTAAEDEGPAAVRTRAERRADRRLARAAQPGYDGAEPVKAGWWWAVNQPPQEADTGLVAFPQPSPPTVPDGALPVAAVGGDPEKVSALEVRLDRVTGQPVDGLVLGLQEALGEGANLNAEEAALVACPVTEPFWADGVAARWTAQPEHDCDLASAAGVRDAEGRWSFDLAPLAALWTADETLSTSVVLVEAVDAPTTFQVAFDGLTSETVGLAAVFGAAPATTDDGTEDGTSDTGSTQGGTTGGTSSSGGSLDSGSDSFAAAPSADAPPPAGDAPAEDDGLGAEQIGTPVAAPYLAPSWYDDLPLATWLLAPLALLVSYLAMVALGPDAQPVPGRPSRGVGQALDRLRLAGAALTPGARR